MVVWPPPFIGYSRYLIFSGQTCIVFSPFHIRVFLRYALAASVVILYTVYRRQRRTPSWSLGVWNIWTLNPSQIGGYVSTRGVWRMLGRFLYLLDVARVWEFVNSYLRERGFVFFFSFLSCVLPAYSVLRGACRFSCHPSYVLPRLCKHPLVKYHVVLLVYILL